MNVPQFAGGRVITQDGQISVATDLLRLNNLILQYLNDGVLRPLLGADDLSPISGFFGDSFKVTVLDLHTVSMQKGIGFLESVGAAEDEPSYRLVHQAEDFEISIDDVVGSSNSRIDIIAIRPAELQEREYRGLVNLESSPTTVVPTLMPVLARPSWDQDLYLFKGEDAADPVAPDVPEGFTPVAQLLKLGSGGGGGITVTDVREVLARGSQKTSHTIILSGDDLQFLPTVISVMEYDSTSGGWKASSTGIGFFGVGKLPIPIPVGAVFKKITVYGQVDAAGANLAIGLRAQTNTDSPLLDGTGIDTLSISDSTGDIGEVQGRTFETSYIVPAHTRLALEVAFDNNGTARAVTLLSVEVEYDY